MPNPKHPLFPVHIREQVADLNTKMTYLKLHASRLGIPANMISNMEAQVSAVNTAQALTDNAETRTKLDTARRNQALRTTLMSMRRLVTFYVTTNPDASPVDFEALRIPQPGFRPHLPVPKYVPGIGHITSYDLYVNIPFFNPQTGKRAKPEGVLALEVYMKIGGEPPASSAEMTERRSCSASPMSLRFDPKQEFQIVYFLFRWIGTRGHYGPWSEVYKTMITR